MRENLTYMIAGLGNPGKEYSQTRHNIGFMVVDALSERYGFTLSNTKFDAELAKGKREGHGLYLMKPMSYMNRSGIPLQRVASYFTIPVSAIVVVHDELDLPFGRMMLVKGRGHGGHNGIRSIIDMLGSKEFIRLRVGVGRPLSEGSDVTGHVLGKFNKDEQKCLPPLIDRAADVCESILSDGILKTMGRINSEK